MQGHEVSIRSFARLARVNESAVRKGIANGRLERALRRDRTTGRVRIDPAVGLHEWRENADPSRQR